jgi:hypothetical protein
MAHWMRRPSLPPTAGAALAAFAVGLAADLLTKAYFVARSDSVIYNHRPTQLVARVAVSALTVAVTAVLARLARWRGLGRLWGAWIGVGILTAGTIGNGVSPSIWAQGVPDFLAVSREWVWNLADFEIVVGLLGGVASIAVNAAFAYARGVRAPRTLEEA